MYDYNAEAKRISMEKARGFDPMRTRYENTADRFGFWTDRPNGETYRENNDRYSNYYRNYGRYAD